MRLTIGLRDKATLRAGTRGIARINHLDDDSGNLSFVLYKGTELTECPRLVPTPLAMSNRAIADTAEVFQGDLAMRVFSLRHKLLANIVVNRTSETGLSTRQSFKVSFGRFGVFTLKGCFEGVYLLSDIVDIFARVEFPIAINGQINNSKVNSKCANGRIWNRFQRIHNYCKVEDAFSENEVSLPNLAVEPCLLVCANSSSDNQSAIEGQKRNFIKPLPRENALVINNSRMRFKSWLNRAVSFVSFRHLTDSSDGHLSRESEATSEFMVDSLLKTKLISRTETKSCISDGVARLVKRYHCL